MSKLNPKKKDERFDNENPLPGGMGSAKQSMLDELRRCVLASLLWEDLAYTTGSANAKKVQELIPKVDAKDCADLAIECRLQQKLRHMPLFIAREMLLYPEHKKHVQRVLEAIITRPDQMSDFMALYWGDTKKSPVPASVKRALANCFLKFNEYSLAKYRGDGKTVTLRDIMFLVHPKPQNKIQEDLFKRVADNKLETPDTWEVELSASQDKTASWTRLLNENKLGGLALLRNLNNMEKAGVSRTIIKNALRNVSNQWLLPLNFYSAYKQQPKYAREIEEAMFKMFQSVEKIKGHTVVVIDLSGSMGAAISSKSQLTRQDAAIALAVFACEQCENITVYATAGKDHAGTHNTERVTPTRGFALAELLENKSRKLGGGGIFTRQALEYIKKDLNGEAVDRILVFSDSQDCDRVNKTPNPFGTRNYIIDVSAHAKGINYKGVWTAEISGWSEKFLDYIRAYEGLEVAEQLETAYDASAQ